MEKLRKFVRLPLDQQWLLCKAAALLTAVRLLLFALPYPSVRPLLSRACRRAGIESSFAPEKYAWSVTAASAIVPGGKHCLSQALTLHILLVRRGFASTICYGVQRHAASPLLAHAWVEYGGKVLIGGDNLDAFVRLMSRSPSPHGTGSRVDPFF